MIDVSLDGSTLLARTSLGWPRMRIPLAEVWAIRPVEVHPLEHGGYGLRIDSTGRSCLITRRGPGVEIMLADGRSYMVTIDDPHRVATRLLDLANQHQRYTRV